MDKLEIKPRRKPIQKCLARCHIIAAEIEKVIDPLASQSFSRAEFPKRLDRFYVAIEHAAFYSLVTQESPD